MSNSTGRNEPCPCGSGKKYKRCCGQVTDPVTAGGPGVADIEAVITLVNAGRLSEAETRLRSLLALHPDAGILWKVLSVALVRQSRDPIDACTKAAALLPSDPEAQHNLGTELTQRKQWHTALPALRRAAALSPRNADFLVDFADALREAGHVGESVEAYQQALRLDARNVFAINNLANALMELRRPAEAVEHYQRALGLRPDEPLILCNLSNALRQNGLAQGALAAAQQALAIDSRSTMARNFIGLALNALGRPAESVAVYREALALGPRDAAVLVSLAQALRDVGKQHEALALCREAVQIDPAFADGHCTLGNLLFDQRLMGEAGRSYERALELQPRHVAALTGRGLVLRQLRRTTDAESVCNAALTIDPNCVEALSLLGELHADLGRFTEAEALFRRAIELNPRFAFAYANIAALRRMTDCESAWQKGAEALLDAPLPLDQRVALHFALGKFFDDTKQHERAFAHFRQGNDLSRSTATAYDPERFTARIDRILGHCDESFIRACRPMASSSDVPVFIIGMPRSGTTLVEQILASHDAVAGAGEIAFWDAAYDTVFPPAAQGPPDPATVADIALAYLQRLGADTAGGMLRVVDKMPANFMYAGLIHAVFPRARFIHMQRHPLDTCLSIYFQNFFSLGRYTNDLDALAHYYAEYTRATERWRRLLPATGLLEVPYEALTENQEEWTRRIIDFAGLEWDPKCLAFQDTNRAVVTASRWQVRQKMSSASSGRWRDYESHLGPLRGLVRSE